MKLTDIATVIRTAIISSKGNVLLEEQISLIKLQMDAKYLNKYSNALINRTNITEPVIEEIASTASKAFDRSADRRIDRYLQSVDDEGTATRDIFRCIVSHLFNAFSYEMPWQNTESLDPHFRRIVYLQVDYKKSNPHRNKINARASYEKQGAKNLKGELFGSREFHELLTEFFSCITSPEQLYQDILKDAEPVFILLRNNRELVKREISEISLLRKEGDSQIIKIKDNPELHNAYKLLESKLKFIERFYIIESWTKYKTEDIRLSQILVLGFLLLMLKYHKYWGDYIGI